jgi:hypothetical protein
MTEPEFVEKVCAFVNERPEYVAALINCSPGNDADYWRWSGGAEARRQLAETLGWTVPHKLGEVAGPKSQGEGDGR